MASIHAHTNKGYTNGWNKPTTRMEYECDDQMCYPVVEDMIGRRRSPIHNNQSGEIYAERVIQKNSPYNYNQYDYGTIDVDNHGYGHLNPQGYVTERVETIIEHVHVPARKHMYPNHSNGKLESIKEYKVSERPLSPAYHHDNSNDGMSYTHKYQPKPFPLLDAENWHNVSHNGNKNGWERSSYYERPSHGKGGQLSGATGKIETLVDYLKDASYAEDLAHNYAKKY